MTKNRSIFIIFFFGFSIFSLLMLVAIGLVGKKAETIILLSFIGYFYLTLISIKMLNNKMSAVSTSLIIILTIIFLQSYTFYLIYTESLFSLPSIIAYFLGVISAYFYFKINSATRFVPFIISSIFIVFMFFQGWNYWLHKVNFDTYTGKVASYRLPVKFEAFNKKKNLITNQDFQNKIVLLDFWTTSCGVCFEKFPQLQEVYDQYKNDSSAMILAVNSPFDEDETNQAFEMIEKRNYNFPVVISKDELLFKKYGVTGFPTTFVINQNGQVVYRGDIEGAIKMVDELKLNIP